MRTLALSRQSLARRRARADAGLRPRPVQSSERSDWWLALVPVLAAVLVCVTVALLLRRSS